MNTIIPHSSKFTQKTCIYELCPSPLHPSVYQQQLAMGQVGRSHKLAAAHLQAPERQIGYCTPMKTVAYNKLNNNTWFQSVVGHSC